MKALEESRLRDLLDAGESDRIEFTNAIGKTEKFAEAICAFANDFPNHGAPGYLLIGVHDDGRPAGREISDKTLREVASLRSNVNLEPLPALTVGKVALPEGDVGIVEVLPSDLPPVRYKGRVWIRVGPSRRAANRQEERILVEKRASRHLPFDLRPCVGSSLDDLVPELFQGTYLPQAVSHDVIEENDRELEEQMASLRFFDPRSRCPTMAGILLFGKEPLRWIPGAWLQFVQWAGDSFASEPIAEEVVSGDLLTVLRLLESIASRPSRARPVAATALRETRLQDYPPVAIRELLLNAVMHRSYESNAPTRFNWFADRIEIQNPGGFYGSASLGPPPVTDYRNPVLAEAMATLGYVNRFGRGIIRAQDALRHNGSPAAHFDLEQASVVATIRRQP